MKQKAEKTKLPIISMIIRVITIPPVIALAMLMYLYFGVSDKIFTSPAQFVLTIVFLCVFSVAAYPVQPLLGKRFCGREAQRQLAMIFSIVGYVAGLIYTLLSTHTVELVYIYLGYLISGALIFIFNKLIRFKLSGHAVGAAGPLAILLGLGYNVWLFGIPLLALVFYSSIKTKRHTVLQLCSGFVLPFAVCVALRFML